MISGNCHITHVFKNWPIFCRQNFKKYQRILWNTSFLGKSLLDVKQGVTEAWSYDHFQPEMGLLGSAGRQDEKKLKLKYAYF